MLRRFALLFVKMWSMDQQNQFYMEACEKSTISGLHPNLLNLNLHFSKIFKGCICTLNFENHCKIIKCFSLVLKELLSSIISLQNMYAPRKQRVTQIMLSNYAVQPSETKDDTGLTNLVSVLQLKR